MEEEDKEEEKNKKYVVFVFGFDLFPMKNLLEGIGSVVPDLPEEFLHVGVAVYNKLFHFTTTGIRQDYSMPKNYKPLRNKDSELDFGTTSKTLKEFDIWCREQHQGDFGDSEYHVITRNCICFARAACQFLKVDFGGPQIPLQTWLETSPAANSVLEKLRINPLFQYLSSTSAKSRSSGSSTQVDVGNTVLKIFNVDAVMEASYTISNSGAQYRKEDASIDE